MDGAVLPIYRNKDRINLLKQKVTLGHQHFGCPLTVNFLTKCCDPAAFQGETLKLWVEMKSACLIHCCVLKQCQGSVGLSVKFFSFFIVFFQEFYRGFTGKIQLSLFSGLPSFSWGGGALRCCFFLCFFLLTLVTAITMVY